MSNIIRAPFYVPRPSDDFSWYGTPQKAPIIPFLTKQKEFGAGGQVPAKRWNSIYTFDDPAVQYAAPVNSPILEYLTKQTMFGKGGQVNFNQIFLLDSLDDASVWKISSTANYLPISLLFGANLLNANSYACSITQEDGAIWNFALPDSSAAIQMLSNSVQALELFTTISYHFNSIDPEPWNGEPVTSVPPVFLSPQTSSSIPTAPFYVSRPAEEQQWLFTRRFDKALNTVIVGPNLKALFWRFNNDDNAVWNQVPTSITVSLQTEIGTSQTRTPFYVPNPVDATLWLSKPDGAAPLPLTPPVVVISSNISRAPFYVPRSDDQPYWCGDPLTAFVGLRYTSTAIYQYGNIYAPFMGFDQDHDGTWQRLTYQTSITQQLTLYQTGNQYSPYISFDFDHIGVWQRATQQTTIAQPSVPSFQSYVGTNFWYLNAEDPTVFWQRPKQRNVALPFLPLETTYLPAWYLSHDDSVVSWRPAVQRNSIYPFLPEIQISYYSARFSSDDAPNWQLTPQVQSLAKLLTISGSATAKQWHWDIDDNAVWWNDTHYDLVINTVQAKPLKPTFWKFNNDDATVSWMPQVQAWKHFPAVPAIEAVYWRFNNDDASNWWQPTRQRSAIYPFLPDVAVPVWNYYFNNDDTAFSWQRPVQRNPIYPFLPFVGWPQWQWHFNYDDAPSVWTQTLQRNNGLPLVPVMVNRWREEIPSDDPWSLTTYHNLRVTIPTVLYRLAPIRWNFNNDDSPVWQQTDYYNLALPTPIGLPFVPVFWNANTDDAAAWWQRTIQRSAALPFVPAIRDRWRPDLAEDQLWTITTRYSFVCPVSFINHVQPVYNLVDEQVWQQTTRLSITENVPPIQNRWQLIPASEEPWQYTVRQNIVPDEQPVINRWQLIPANEEPWQFTVRQNIVPDEQPVINRWQLNVADDQLWSLTLRQNNVPSVPPMINRWQLIPADEQVWSLTAQRDMVIEAIPFSTVWRTNVEDSTVWQKQPSQFSRVFFYKPLTPVFWSFNFDDGAVTWKPPLQRTPNIITKAPPFILRQSSFLFDEQSNYQWPMRSSIIASLTWKINANRIAVAPAENRIAVAPAENRFAVAPAENRFAIAPAKRHLNMITWDSIAPTEVLLSGINWTARLGTDTISSSVWTTTDSTPITFVNNNPQYLNGFTYIWISGGILGNSYTLINTILTASGDTEVETVAFVCAAK